MSRRKRSKKNSKQNSKVAQNNSPLTKELQQQEEQLKNFEVELNSKDELERLKKELASLEKREQESRQVEEVLKEQREFNENISQLNRDISKSKDEKENLEIDDKQNHQKDLKKDTDKLKRRNELLEKELEDKYSRFVYQPKKNEMSNLKSSNSDSFREFSVPKFALPEVGTLFENKDSYFLEISDFDELDKANELKKRYTDKNYKVVVREESEQNN